MSTLHIVLDNAVTDSPIEGNVSSVSMALMTNNGSLLGSFPYGIRPDCVFEYMSSGLDCNQTNIGPMSMMVISHF